MAVNPATQKMNYVQRERRTSRIAALADALYWLQQYPVDTARQKMMDLKTRLELELAQDAALQAK